MDAYGPVRQFLRNTGVHSCGLIPEAKQAANRNSFHIDGNVSVNVEAISIGRLLRLWDQATGMHSSIPQELANRTVSIHFSGLTVSDSVRKIFEKLPFDYVFIEGQGIVVTGPSQLGAGPEPAPVYTDVQQVADQPSEQEVRQPQPPAEPPQPPPMIQTPFGPIPNSGSNGVVQLPPVPGEAPPIPFFAPARPVVAPAGAPNGPAQNNLFRPISIYQNP